MKTREVPAALLDWLLEGDISIRFQVHRDLLGSAPAETRSLQARIGTEGWGKRLLDCQGENGHWGRGFYQPKWTSSHYTLLLLRQCCLPPGNSRVDKTIRLILEHEKGEDGGVNPTGTVKQSDVCINGMFLNYASWFRVPGEDLKTVVDFLLAQGMADGGFNCRSNRSGARHSSLHTTLSVVEGIREYIAGGYTYRLAELMDAEAGACEFMLRHRLFLSDHTGEIIRKEFLKLVFPPRWKYDILRALDYFRLSSFYGDHRLTEAMTVLKSKRRKDGTWPLHAPYPGQVHFKLEETGKSSRWNTLRALRVKRAIGI